VNKTPVLFTVCGGGEGVCVPPALVTDPVQNAALKAVDDPTGAPGMGCTQKDSAGASYLCAPKKKAKDQSYNFPTCTSTSLAVLLGSQKNMAGQSAGCVPKYLVPSAKQSLVLKDDCTGANDLCATCTDPTSTPTANMPTGACPWP